jgi:integrase
MGMNPVKIAAITGHDVKTLLTHYAGLVDKPTVPELELFG